MSYLGVLQQALRDLSAWVEKGTAPPATTKYVIEDGQVIVHATAVERKGIQPVVVVKANGRERADVKMGQPVIFTAEVEVPPHAGKIVAAEWDFAGTGTFPEAGKFTSADNVGSRVTLKTTHTFAKPGTYFTTLRAVSQRLGDVKTPYSRIQIVGRVRVIVR